MDVTSLKAAADSKTWNILLPLLRLVSLGHVHVVIALRLGLYV